MKTIRFWFCVALVWLKFQLDDWAWTIIDTDQVNKFGSVIQSMRKQSIVVTNEE